MNRNSWRMGKRLSLLGHKPDFAIYTYLFLFLSLFTTSINAETSTPTDKQMLEFDHLTSAFELIGAHQFLVCEQCHRGAVFKGTPRLCDECHDNNLAIGQSATHIPTVEQCDVCHTTYATFWTNEVLDHSIVTKSCITCHDIGTVSFGKSGLHIATTNLCETCHYTNTFVPAQVVDHAQVLGSCPSCHNGTIAPLL